MSERRTNSYRAAGVDRAAADASLDAISEAVRSTYDARVLKGIGAFGGLFALDGDTVLVASTDGVGTKTRLAAAADHYRTIGADLVNHCVNDILAQGAEPLFFLDYVAAARLEPAVIAEVVAGMAAACRAANMPLLGGETAEMPGVYLPGELDLVGTIVGRVRPSAIVDGSTVQAGDRLLALTSGGLQTNGFTLARAVLDEALEEPFAGATVRDALLAPHRSFLAAVRPLLATGRVRALAHITGGGIPGNLPRALPAGLGAVIDSGSWQEPGIFDLIRQRGGVAESEMRAVFNLGVGFIVVCRSDDVADLGAACPEALHAIGSVEPGAGVRYLG